jgi:DNA-binding NtrC family response regulator
LCLGNVEVRIEADPSALRVVDGPESYGALIARSPAMRQLFSILQRLEGSLVNVLIQGESGTGKELLARAIHDNSSVSGGPFVAVNCGSLDRELVRSELFGHRKGAFTGAIESRVGAFEAAAGGTLFLDEVGELPLDVQPMLLRALEERSIVRVGENTPRSVRVRLVAATNRKVEEQVAEGAFREDLYYRLMVVRLEVPALRERAEDIPALANAFAERAGAARLPSSVLAQLAGHYWPGNVRELRHAVESYLAIGMLPFSNNAQPPSIDRFLLPYVDLDRSYQDLKGEIVDAFTRVYLTRLLAHTGGNVSTAAKISGVERSYLNKLARRLGVKA